MATLDVIGLTALGHDFGNLRRAMDGIPATETDPDVVGLFNTLLASASVLVMVQGVPEALEQEAQLFRATLAQLDKVWAR